VKRISNPPRLEGIGSILGMHYVMQNSYSTSDHDIIFDPIEDAIEAFSIHPALRTTADESQKMESSSS